MVENTTAFENSGSLSLGDSLLLEEDQNSNSNSNEYEVVSHNGSDIRSAPETSTRNAYFGSGILILDGAEDDGVEENGSLLSVPGTDSLPTDVGTLNGQYVSYRSSWSIPKYAIFLLSTVLLGLGYTTYTTYTWRYSSLQKDEQIAQHLATIQRLEQQVQEKDMALEYFDESDYVTVFDNCWVKAKARWCDKGGPGSFPQLFGGAIGEASKLVTETVASLTDSMKEVPEAASSEFKAAADAVTKVTDVLSLFVGAAGDAMVAELQEFSDNPMDYMAEAVKGTHNEQEITGNGIDEVMNVVKGKTFYMTDEEAAAAKEASA
eukprot:CAMPEP_0113616610 /NCGR_PEP_ID=MMETSP0017_2-20120614/8329_1 /TAXON_ID=2856 /ORGANISM="Cylindrotheca closterium" /LENGTH=319 /DNA_ID=CAMNT_0000525931 /DNA_START=181 /DNA_END=1140 /DNA_ORIENTATION=+ /assembly_acc=CAM_ASM_000147